MKTKLLNSIQITLVATFLSGICSASTFVSGNVSGTWSTSGSPYVATGNLTVPSGQTLTIQPGVTLIIGQGLNMVVEGSISAIGSGASPIIIRGANAGLYWDKILVNYRGMDSSFINCKISDATNALFLNISGTLVGSVSMNTLIQNCVFTNCQDKCVYGYAHGYVYATQSGVYANSPTLSPKIFNCLFAASSNGCLFLADGSRYSWGQGGSATAYGTVNPQIANCDFLSITGSAIYFSAGSYAGTSYPNVHNNVFVQCNTSVQKNSLTLFNDVIAYNCFFNNATNFVGYPAGVYGTISWVNDNGTPCDLAYNILSDPLFAETTTYTLAANSPCIDAGSPDWALTDMCFPPSQGTSVADIGIYGGPNAANWLSVVPLLPVQTWLSKTNNQLLLNWGALPRSSYQVLYKLDLSSTNKWMTNNMVLAMDKPTAIAVTPYPATNNAAFYRVRSLGRASGN